LKFVFATQSAFYFKVVFIQQTASTIWQRFNILSLDAVDLV